MGAHDLRLLRWHIFTISLQSFDGHVVPCKIEKNEKASIDDLEMCMRLLRPWVRDKGVAKPHVGHCVRWLRDCCGQPELASRLRKMAAHRNAEAHPDSRALLADLHEHVQAMGSEPEPDAANAKSSNEQEAKPKEGRSDSFMDEGDTLHELQKQLADLKQSHDKLQEEASHGAELQLQLTQVKQSHDNVQKQAEQAKVHALQVEADLSEAQKQINALQTKEADMQREHRALLDKVADSEDKQTAMLMAKLDADVAAFAAKEKAKEKYKGKAWNSKW